MITQEVSRTSEHEFDIRVMSMNERDLDAQPFGVIRLDRDGVVLSYNLYEERQARRKRRDVVAKNFFIDIAPCTRVKEFYGRFLLGVERRELNATFGFVFHFPHKTRNVDVSLYYKKGAQMRDDTIWVIIRG